MEIIKMKIRTIIIDDELPICDEIEYLLQSHPDIIVNEKFNQCQSALNYIQSTPCDLIFLDINMPRMNGLDFAECINNLHLNPLIVFVTAYQEYALTAFDTPAIGYITKPITQAKLTKTLAKIRRLLPNRAIETPAPILDKLCVKKDNCLIPVAQSSIILAYVKDKEAFLRTKDGDFPLQMSFADLVNYLKPPIFLRIHRQYIVNLNSITKVIPWFHSSFLLQLQYYPDIDIPVSRTHAQELRNLLGIK